MKAGTEETELPLCVCGCEERVTKVGNRFVYGHQRRGKKLTEDHKRKLSEAQMGEKNHNWGKTASAETRGKMSKSGKGRKHSEEHNRNLSKALKGMPKSAEWRKKLSEANKGKKLTEEQKRKISEATSGEKNPMWGRKHTEKAKAKMSVVNRGEGNPMWGKHHTEETLCRMAEAQGGENHPMWGKHHTEETKDKLSKANSGENAPMWGKHHTEEARRRMSDAHKVENLSEETRCKMSRSARNKPLVSEETKRKMSETRRGENNGRWRGGISFEPYGPMFDKKLKTAIRERDGFICQLCGIPENSKAHTCHHVDYIKMNNYPENFTTLCVPCHSRTSVNRAFWQNLFSARFKLGLVPSITV